MVLPDEELIVEDKHPWKDRLAAMQAELNPTVIPTPMEDGYTLINEWHSRRLRCLVSIIRHNGRTIVCRTNRHLGKRVNFLVQTMGVSCAWDLDAELKAQALLQTLVKPHIWQMYVCTGTFLETSRRSQLTYIFRRCRPTLVVSPHTGDDHMRVVTALCLHPIAYYAKSFGGGMTPTDDVIAHLLLMRGDEHLYWRRANQHDPDSPEAGL